MSDFVYKPEDVDAGVRPIFEQLRTEFGAVYEVWRRIENFGRWVSAAVVNRSTGTVAIIEIRAGNRLRTTPLDPSETQRIRSHLESNADLDLNL